MTKHKQERKNYRALCKTIVLLEMFPMKIFYYYLNFTSRIEYSKI